MIIKGVAMLVRQKRAEKFKELKRRLDAYTSAAAEPLVTENPSQDSEEPLNWGHPD